MIPQAVPVTLDTTKGWTRQARKARASIFVDPSTGATIALGIFDPLEEPYWLDDLDLARRHLAREYAPIGCLIEANPITLGGVQGMAQLWKRPIPDQEHGLIFGVTVFLAKTTLTAHIMYWIDGGCWTTGIREAVVLEKLMRGGGHNRGDHTQALAGAASIRPRTARPIAVQPRRPRGVDEMLPGHPLTCVRALAPRL